MATISALGACVLLGGLTVFQMFLAFGAPWGRFAWGGKHRVLPPSLRVGSVISVVIYALVATVVTARADLWSLAVSQGALEVAVWVVVVYFFLGIGLNLASSSRPEQVVMTPICAMLFVLCGVTALG